MAGTIGYRFSISYVSHDGSKDLSRRIVISYLAQRYLEVQPQYTEPALEQDICNATSTQPCGLSTAM